MALADRDDGPFVVRLAREPGKRESRYAHLFSGEVQSGAAATSAAADPDHSPSLGARVYRLEQQVADLAEQIRVTLFHELGHYLGLSEEELDESGYA